MGDSRSAHEVQLILSLDSLCDNFKAHSFGHLNKSAHNPLTAPSCQALHEASVNFHNIKQIYKQSRER